jgi:hypothetical protein
MRWRLLSVVVVLVVALALVLSWSFGVIGASASTCIKVDPVGIKELDQGIAAHAALDTVYAVKQDAGTWMLAARVPASGVAVWKATLVPSGTNVGYPFLYIDPQNKAAIDNWKGESAVKQGGQVYGQGWDKEMLRLIQAQKTYRQAVACTR